MTGYSPDQATQAASFSDGFQAGWTAAAPTMEQRDEWIARRIVALMYSHEHPLPDDITSYIDRNADRWARAESTSTPTGVPTYAECMASWGMP